MQSMCINTSYIVYFVFIDTSTTKIYTLSLHDALPISAASSNSANALTGPPELPELVASFPEFLATSSGNSRSEEHTSELQSQSNLVCRLLLEKKKDDIYNTIIHTSITLIDYMISIILY